MKIVCCCVTEDRPEFMPWLLWNFEKQTHQDKELMIVDSKLSIPIKRNECLDRADGDAIAWFDDDDWQSSQRLEDLASKMDEGTDIVGTQFGGWINLETQAFVGHESPMMIFNSCLTRMDIARCVRFDESMLKASDTKWMREILTKCHPKIVSKRLHAWVCHEKNICNPASSRDWSKGVTVRSILGEETASNLRSISERVAV